MSQIDPSLSEKYIVQDKGDKWHLSCKICKVGFSLKKTSESLGNLLALLDHYIKCEKNGNIRNK